MSLRMALLGLLIGKGPASGYTLSKTFQDTLRHVWSASHSQVYPELGRMTEAGLVTVEIDGPRGRKCYTVTEAGRAALEHWLVDEEPGRTVRSELALRAFLLPLVDRRRGAALTDAEAEYHRQRSRQLTELRDLLDAPPRNDFGRYAAELGARLSRAIAEWAEWATGQLLAEEAALREGEDKHASRKPPRDSG